MAYTKLNWKNQGVTGAIPISADNLNHMDEGIEANDILNNNNTTHIGTLSSLNTTNKTNLVNAINEINNKFNYSTTETKIGTWIDGKPVYRIVIEYTTTSQANLGYNIDVSSLNIETMIKAEGVGNNTALLSDTQAILMNSSKTKVTIYFNNSSATSYNGHIILKYTKTTDIAN